MYALAIIRYTSPLEVVLKSVEAHRAYCRELMGHGTLLASGPFEPRTGGCLLLRVPDDAVEQRLAEIRDNDPYTLAGVATYELLPWSIALGQAQLDKLGLAL